MKISSFAIDFSGRVWYNKKVLKTIYDLVGRYRNEVSVLCYISDFHRYVCNFYVNFPPMLKAFRQYADLL